MKKALGLFFAAALLIMIVLFRAQKKEDSAAEAPKPETKENLDAPLPDVKQEVQTPAKPEDDTWIERTLAHQLTPEFIQTWTQKNGIDLKQETKGHPKSGQRLELTWGSDPATTAVFDIMGPQQVQLSAVRSFYSANSSLSGMKAMLQDKIKRPIEREDDQSVVFAADERGLTVWLSQQSDGRLKLAFEYGAHSHSAEGP